MPAVNGIMSAKVMARLDTHSQVPDHTVRLILRTIGEVKCNAGDGGLHHAG